MFVGIVASSVYDQSERVSISQGAIGNALGYDINFEGPKVTEEPKGIRLHLPMEVRKEDAQFTALPDIRSERTRNGQIKRFVHPHIRRGILSDLYISPIDFNPGERESLSHLDLKKGETIQVGDYEMVFTAFDVSSGMGQRESKELSVGANLLVSYKEQDPVELKPLIKIGGEHQHSGPLSRVKLPGPHESYVTLESLNAGAKTIHLDYQSSKTDIEEEDNLPSVIAEVSIKPGMTVLWLGTVLMLSGGVIAIARRWNK